MDSASAIILLIVSLAALAAVVALVAATLAWQQQRRAETLLETLLRREALRAADTDTALDTDTAPDTAPTPVVSTADSRRVLAAPPKVPTDIGALPAGDWLAHYARRGTTWAGVVTEFYNRLLRVETIKALFPESPSRVAQIKAHFTRVMVTITRKGITAADVEALRTAHARIPITGVIYDQVVGTLVEVLSDAGVPGYAIQDLGRMLAEAELRDVLVHEVVPA